MVQLLGEIQCMVLGPLKALPSKRISAVSWRELVLMRLGYYIARPFFMQELSLCLLNFTLVSLPCNTSKRTEREPLKLGLLAYRMMRNVNIYSLQVPSFCGFAKLMGNNSLMQLLCKTNSMETRKG